MPRFVARPITIEAHQWLGSPAGLPPAFSAVLAEYEAAGAARIQTADGLVACAYGDWLARGGDGVVGVVRAGEFDHRYMTAEQAVQQADAVRIAIEEGVQARLDEMTAPPPPAPAATPQGPTQADADRQARAEARELDEVAWALDEARRTVEREETPIPSEDEQALATADAAAARRARIAEVADEAMTKRMSARTGAPVRPYVRRLA